MAKHKFELPDQVCTVICLFDQDGNNAFFDPEDPRGMQLSELLITSWVA